MKPFNKSILLAFLLIGSSNAIAGAKNAIAVGSVNVIKASDMGWRTIIPTSISSSMNKALQINVSLECGLYTNTVSKSQNMVSDTSAAYAGVDVQVLVDGVPASPGPVTFCNRMQQLTATLQGALLSCTNMLDMSSCSTTAE